MLNPKQTPGQPPRAEGQNQNPISNSIYSYSLLPDLSSPEPVLYLNKAVADQMKRQRPELYNFLNVHPLQDLTYA